MYMSAPTGVVEIHLQMKWGGHPPRPTFALHTDSFNNTGSNLLGGLFFVRVIPVLTSTPRLLYQRL